MPNGQDDEKWTGKSGIWWVESVDLLSSILKYFHHYQNHQNWGFFLGLWNWESNDWEAHIAFRISHDTRLYVLMELFPLNSTIFIYCTFCNLYSSCICLEQTHESILVLYFSYVRISNKLGEYIYIKLYNSGWHGPRIYAIVTGTTLSWQWGLISRIWRKHMAHFVLSIPYESALYKHKKVVCCWNPMLLLLLLMAVVVMASYSSYRDQSLCSLIIPFLEFEILCGFRYWCLSLDWSWRAVS